MSNSTEFEHDELVIMAIYMTDTPKASARKIEEALPYVDDPDMVTLMSATKEKLERLPDEEYRRLDLNMYILEGED